MISLPQAISAAKSAIGQEGLGIAYSAAFLYEFTSTHPQDVIITVGSEPGKQYTAAITDAGATIEEALTNLYDPTPRYPREDLNRARCKYIRVTRWVEVRPKFMRFDAQFDIPCHPTPVPKEPHV